jgi:hypothetical protein
LITAGIVAAASDSPGLAPLACILCIFAGWVVLGLALLVTRGRVT